MLKPSLSHRRLCLVLLDLIGSTAFVEKAGPMRAARWLQYHDRLTRSLIRRFKGREIDRSDGFLISFELPVNAVNFALHYQMTVPLQTKLKARIGLHLGDVVEVKQHELDRLQGTKPIELEGVSKNIAARIMALCAADQVLMSQEAFRAIRNKTNYETPRGVRYAQVGLYKFKGVRSPVVVYAVGLKTATLQPPLDNAKARRLGGPKKVRSHLRHMRFFERVAWALYRLALLSVMYISAVFLAWASRPEAQRLWGFDHWPWSILPLFRRFFSVIFGFEDG